MLKGKITVTTSQQTEFIDITAKVEEELRKAGGIDGICYLFNPHTTAGITINEGADPAVKHDILAVLNQIIPWKFAYRHMEGNSPAHLKASLVGSSIMVFVDSGRLVLGTWQKIFFAEFDGGRTRSIFWRLIP